MLEKLRPDDFKQHLNSRFVITAKGGERADMSLTEVTVKEDEYTECISIIFKADKDVILPHDTHSVAHEALGVVDLFMGPVFMGKSDGVYYQAIINRLKIKSA